MMLGYQDTRAMNGTGCRPQDMMNANTPQIPQRERQPEISEMISQIESRVLYLEENFANLINRIEPIMGTSTKEVNVAKDADSLIVTKLGSRLYEINQRLARLGAQVYHTAATVQL